MNRKDKSSKFLHRWQQPFSLAAYIGIVMTAALIISLISFHLFWQSDARQLSVEIQKATEKNLDNPFFLPIDEADIDTADKILKSAELHQIQNQIDQLAEPLKPEVFQLKNNSDINILLNL